jgi:Tfp pilus assembly protein PilZ
VNEERREHVRLVLSLQARWEDKAGQHAARISNLSSGGCFIESQDPATTGERIRVQIELPVERWMELSGEVIRLHPDGGFAIRFSALTISEQSTLAQLIDYARGV